MKDVKKLKKNIQSGLKTNKQKLINLIRCYIAEVFLFWAFSAAPDDQEGDQIKVAIGKYFYDKVREQDTV